MSRTIIGVTIILITVIKEAECRGKQWYCPPLYKCECHSRNSTLYTANCNNLNLTSVPKFDQKFERLKFNGNILKHVNRSTFENIKTWNITELFIANCKIETIAHDTFRDLKLDFIDFSGNRQINRKELGYCFKNLNLKGLDVAGIPLAKEIFSFFNTSASSNLTFLRVASCGLTHLNKTVFQLFPNLEDIDISSNQLHSIDLTVLPPIMTLTARSTGLTELPTYGNQTDVSLTQLDVSCNLITNIDTFFKYGHVFHRLKVLNIDSNPLKSLPLTIFSRLKSLHELSMCNVTSVLSSLEGIHSTSLRTLNISYNSLNSKSAPEFFKNAKNIKYLKMNGTSLIEWTDDEIFELFMPLCHSLKKFYLVNSYFKKIPSHALRCFKHMEILDLSSNNISGWSEEEKPFENVTVKKRFVFKNNLITIINKTSFPESLMCKKKTPFLNFHGNPFSCTCQAHWFRNWMKYNYHRLGGPFGNNLYCNSPEQREGQPFVNYDPQYEDCHGMNKVVIAGISLCGASVFLVSLITYLKNKYSKTQSEQLGYKIIE